MKLSDSDQLTGFFEADGYDVDGRGAGATSHRPRRCSGLPGFAWNGNYTKVLSYSSVFDAQVCRVLGLLLPDALQRRHARLVQRQRRLLLQNSSYFYKADRVRHQANASLTKYASDFAGDHNFKFGAEFERSYVKSQYGYPAACTSSPTVRRRRATRTCGTAT